MSKQAYDLLHPAIRKAVWDLRWDKLRPLQTDSILSFSRSSSPIILSAATASGKTEAAFLPVLSSIARDPKPSIQAIYVGPLKALINDQFKRLERLCEHAEIPVHKWHGDVSHSQKEKLRKKPRGVLLITPESLESNFINHGHRLKNMYQHLEHVVIDELHTFVSDTRGLHLRSLLSRLEMRIGKRPRLIGLSATLGAYEDAMAFLSPNNPAGTIVIKDASSTRDAKIGLKAYLRHDDPTPEVDQQEKEDEGVPDESEGMTADEYGQAIEALDKDSVSANPTNPLASLEPPAERKARPLSAILLIARDIADRYALRTNLIFCNTKSYTERLADRLNMVARARKWGYNPFLVHHGALSSEARQEAERKLKEKQNISIICTSTLEMGIDVGEVHAVAQIGPPNSVCSLVQRLGRSGRKEGQHARLRMYCIDQPPGRGADLGELIFPNLLRSIALLELHKEGWLEPPEPSRYNASTFIHQTLSLLKETGGRPPAIIQRILCAAGPFRSIDKEIFKDILRSLHRNDVIEQTPEGLIILAPKGEAIASSRSFYASFMSSELYSVRHKGREIASIPLETLPKEGQQLILDGKRWKVTGIDSQTRTIEVSRSRKGEAPKFAGSLGAIHPRIRKAMKQALESEQSYGYLSSEGRMLLGHARAMYRKSGLDVCSLIEGEKKHVWFPWTGTKAVETLRLAALHLGLGCELGYDGLSLQFAPERPDVEKYLRKLASGKVDPVELAGRMDDDEFERFDNLLPSELLNKFNAEDRLDMPGAVLAAKDLLSELEESKALDKYLRTLA